MSGEIKELKKPKNFMHFTPGIMPLVYKVTVLYALYINMYPRCLFETKGKCCCTASNGAINLV